jgi:DNA gyrase inhibitor GyrI
MAGFEARIENLERMRVASVHAFGESPEREAWKKMEAWANPIGLLDNIEKHPVFGFNNPDPSPECNEYGYEFWVAVDPEIEAGSGIELKEFDGGRYAVTSCNLFDEINSEFFRREGYLESWKKLHDWVKENQLKPGRHQALERPHDPRVPEEELVLDLYFPIEE